MITFDCAIELERVVCKLQRRERNDGCKERAKETIGERIYADWSVWPIDKLV